MQAALEALITRLIERIDRRIDALEARMGKGEEELDTKYLQLLEKMDNLKNWLIGIIIGSIIIPALFMIVAYYLNHPK